MNNKLIPALSESDLARFWDKVAKTIDDSCWPWTGSQSEEGYGSFGIGRKIYKAHRVAFLIANGRVSNELEVCHHCDNPCCCRPDHLFEATHAENIADMMRKGRGKKATGDRSPSRLHPESRPRGDKHWTRRNPELVPRGQDTGRAKLTEAKVLAIRALYASGEYSQQQLAVRFSVTKTLVRYIVKRRVWVHI